jgi:hypothetical protein
MKMNKKLRLYIAPWPEGCSEVVCQHIPRKFLQLSFFGTNPLLDAYVYDNTVDFRR